MLLYIFTGYLTYLLNAEESGFGHIQQITHFYITQLTNVYSCVTGFNSNIHTYQTVLWKKAMGLLSQSDEEIPPPHYALYAKNAQESTICLLAHTTFPCARFHYL